jgi:L-seryl-tRNA(Ser) seleniumtransferase
MEPPLRQELLRALPSIDRLLQAERVAEWLAQQPRSLVAQCAREAVEDLREQILKDSGGRCGPQHVTEEYVLSEVARRLDARTRPHLRGAINATGIILHTGLGRAVWPECVVDSMIDELKGYVTLAIEREEGKRSERDGRVEYILTELTGAEAATVVNNNAAATMLVLAALGAGREVIVSRGELIEIGGSFRLPDVMAQSGARMVEVGTTNRTHLRDYERAITDETALIFRAHPSNYRVVGFTHSPSLEELVTLGRSRGIPVVDDLGAGALIGLERFGLPHEPRMQDSIAAGADVVLSSTDKLIGAAQGGVILGGRPHIQTIRKHPLARALRVDKTCLMALERTLYLFRDEEKLIREHPTYRMLATSPEALQARGERLAELIQSSAPCMTPELREGVGFLGSGSLPMEKLPTWMVAVRGTEMKASELARRLRLDEACVFTRIEDDAVLLDARTLRDDELPRIASAMKRICGQS